jgi:hypothetical protein
MRIPSMAWSPFSMKTKTEYVAPQATREPRWLEVIRECVGKMRFGTVQVVVHEGRVTQVDATHRTRLSTETK